MQALCEELTHGELEDRVYFMPSFLPCGKAGGLQIRCRQGLAVDLLWRRHCRLGSEALRLLQHWGSHSHEFFRPGTSATNRKVCHKSRKAPLHIPDLPAR